MKRDDPSRTAGLNPTIPKTETEERFLNQTQRNRSLGRVSVHQASRFATKPRKSNAGRKPIDVVLMFKLLLLQKLYNISDEQLEYQVNDRLSFMQFLGLSLADAVPDATSVWLFRQQIRSAGLVEALFEKFETYLLSSWLSS